MTSRAEVSRSRTRTLPRAYVQSWVTTGFPVVAVLPTFSGMLAVALVAPRHRELRPLLIPSPSESADCGTAGGVGQLALRPPSERHEDAKRFPASRFT